MHLLLYSYKSNSNTFTVLTQLSYQNPENKNTLTTGNTEYSYKKILHEIDDNLRLVK